MPSKRKRRRVLVFACFILLAGFLWLLPTIIAKSAIRDLVLNSIANAPQYQISSRRASFGWFTPLVVDDLMIKKADHSVSIKIQKLSADKSWFALWLSSPDLGSFTIVRPQLDVAATDDSVENENTSPNVLMPTLTAIIQDAHIVVRNQSDDQPEIDVDNIDLTTHFENVDSTNFLSVEPIQVFDRLAISRELCNTGLQLIAPVLKNEINIEGSLSLELTRIRLPLGTSQIEFAKLAEVQGTFQLHHLSAGINNEMTKRLARMFAELFKLGEIPNQWKLTDGATIMFEVRNGRVFHDSLTIILPDVSPDFSIQTSGLVSIDEEIDVRATIQIPMGLLGESQLARKISQTPIEFRITGALPELKIGLPTDPKWVIELSQNLLSNSLTAEEKELANDFIELIAELHRESSDIAEKLPEPLLKRIQSLQSVDHQ